MTLTPNRPSRHRPPRETYEVAQGVARQIRALGERMAGEDPEELRYLLILERRLEEALRHAIRGQRSNGYTWEHIGTVLGTSRQGAQQRFPD